MDKNFIFNLLDQIDNEHTRKAYQNAWLRYFSMYDTVTQDNLDNFYKAIKANRQLSSNTKSQVLNGINYATKRLNKRGSSLEQATIPKQLRLYGKVFIPKHIRDNVDKALDKAYCDSSPLSQYIYYRDIAIHELLKHALRRSELCNIQNKHIYFNKSNLIIEVIGKGDKLRKIVASNRLKAAIGEIMLHSQNIPNLQLDDNTHLILNKALKPLSSEGVRYLFEKWYGKLYSPHCLRATLATELLNSNLSESQIIAWFGWSSIDTAKHYNLSSTEKFNDIVAILQ